MDLPIIIPSRGRAASVLTKISGARLFVPEAEADAYRRHNPDVEILTHAPTRNLAHKRQTILDRWPSVFMLDDDIAFVSRLYLPGNNRETHLSPEEARELIQATATSARRAGCFLFGFSNWPNAKHYYPHKPIRLSGYINASAFGILSGSSLYFTEKTTAAESHWINLLNAYFHRRSYQDSRFCFAQEPGSTFFRPGGQTANRTQDTEKADTLFLRRMFGDAVRIRKNRGDAALAHPYQRTIHLPF
jgi:hypothetical protein